MVPPRLTTLAVDVALIVGTSEQGDNLTFELVPTKHVR